MPECNAYIYYALTGKLLLITIYMFAQMGRHPSLYGRYVTNDQSLMLVPAKVGWIVMHLPSFLIPVLLLYLSGSLDSTVKKLLLYLFFGHYFHRQVQLKPMFGFRISVYRWQRCLAKKCFCFHCGEWSFKLQNATLISMCMAKSDNGWGRTHACCSSIPSLGYDYIAISSLNVWQSLECRTPNYLWFVFSCHIHRLSFIYS